MATGLLGEQPADRQSAAEAPAEAARQLEAQIVQAYARVLTESLGRKGRAPWQLAGLAVYADLQALQASLARCLSQHESPLLRHWHATLARALLTYGPAFVAVAQGQEWLEALRQVLEAPPLPTAEAPEPHGAQVARQLAGVLGWIADQRNLPPWLETFRQHLFTLSTSYWCGLFACYDVRGLPRTTNALEGRFGQLRRTLRRRTGLKDISQLLQRQGAWLMYASEDATVADLEHRLAQVPVAVLQAERARFLTRQERFRYRYRWRHNRQQVLDTLEQQWAAYAARSSC